MAAEPFDARSSSARASGGSVTACRLAQAARNVLLLERGRPYPPGAFPRTPRAVRDGAFWRPRDGRHGLWDAVELPRPRRGRVERPRRRLADLRERRAAQGRGDVRRRRARALAGLLRRPRAALRDRRGDAGRGAVSGRPRAVRLDAEDERAARGGRAVGLDAFRAEHRGQLRPGRRGAGRAARAGAERPRRAALLVPAVRRVHRRLPVRGQEHARLHVPERGAGGAARRSAAAARRR